ncbi:MAG: response regulator [Gemmatimonadales bacterium]
MDVLVVDDDADVRRTFKKALERAGFAVVAVESGLQAVAELRERHFRAIVSDIQMEFLEGRRFFDELVSEYPEMVPRVVFATGFADDEGISQFLRNAGRPVLRKPVDMKELVAVVRRVVGDPPLSIP